MEYLLFGILTILGVCVGSFLNVLIYRIPKGEEFVKTPSHCMCCGHALAWYENIPLVSWLLQRGKCRACGAKLSAQYPIVEALNGLMWLVTALVYRGDWVSVGLYCVMFSMLLTLSVIDWRTFVIPNGINLVIFLLGVVRLLTDLSHWSNYVIGMLCVSTVFLALHLLTRGQGLGMGDVKLMAGAGLLLGWSSLLVALVIGSVSGAIIHSIRMRRGADRKLAFGPYLAAGIWIAALGGEQIVRAYFGLFGL